MIKEEYLPENKFPGDAKQHIIGTRLCLVGKNYQVI